MGQYYTAIFLKPREENKQDEVTKAYHPHDFDNGAKLMESSWIGNDFDNFVEAQLLMNPQRVVWAGDYADEEPDGQILHDIGYEMRTTEGNAYTDGMLDDCYVVNHDKKQFYKRPEYNKKEWTVNPLPILTSEGNGRGGGDYFGEECKDLVGVWARDTIELTAIHPTEDYTEIFPEFVE